MGNKIDTYVDKYIQLRDKKTQLQRKHEEELKPINEAMARLESLFGEELINMGAESVKTPFGTVYRSVKRSFKINDWASDAGVLKFIQDNELWHFLDKRLNKTALTEYLEEHESLPPGVEVRSFEKVNVRRS